MENFYTLDLENNVNYKLYLPNAQSNSIEQYITKYKVPFEYHILKDIILRIPPKSAVLDIGANIGNHSIFLAANGFKIYAFEAQKKMIDIVKKSIAINHFENLVTLYEYGLSDKCEEAYFEVENHENYGAMSLTCIDSKSNREYQGEKVICKPLDSFNITEKISLIKIDVEGMEPKVIRGGGILIMRNRPIIIAEAWQNTYYELSSLMTSLNYVLWLSYDAGTHLFLPKEQISNQEILRVKKHLSYRLGSALIKNPFTFIFKARRIYREWKEERK